MTEKVFKNFVVIGAGSIGCRHHSNLLDLGMESLLIPYRALSGVKLNRILSSETGVIVATSTDIRLQLLREISSYSSALLIEKPLGFQVEHLDEIYSLPCIDHDASMAGFMTRYHPTVQWLLKEDLTDVVHARFSIGHDVTKWRDDWRFANSYASKPNGGGVLLDLCHEIDLADVLFGPLHINSVQCMDCIKYPGIDLLSHISMSSPDTGALVSVTMDYLASHSHRSVEMYSNTRNICVDLLTGLVVIKGLGHDNEHISHVYDRDQWFKDMIKDFVDVRSRTDSCPTLNVTKKSNYLIADLWGRRSFVSTLSEANLFKEV